MKTIILYQTSVELVGEYIDLIKKVGEVVKILKNSASKNGIFPEIYRRRTPKTFEVDYRLLGKAEYLAPDVETIL